MVVSNKEIEKKLYSQYVDLRNTKWVFAKDTRYELPTLAQLKKCLSEVSIKNLKMPNGSDCDDRALQLMARVRFKHPLWPFGECSGILIDDNVFGSQFLPHDRNICVTTEGIKVIEPANDDIIEPSDGYRVYWIRL